MLVATAQFGQVPLVKKVQIRTSEMPDLATPQIHLARDPLLQWHSVNAKGKRILSRTLQTDLSLAPLLLQLLAFRGLANINLDLPLIALIIDLSCMNLSNLLLNSVVLLALTTHRL